MPDTRISLLDEQVRLALVAAAEALAAAAGRLYPLVYVGPLVRADLLTHATSDAAGALGIAFTVWSGEDPRRGEPAIVLCRSSEILSAQQGIDARTQLIAWGDVPADLPREIRDEVLRPENLVVDLAGSGVWPARDWPGGNLPVAVVRPGEPLVLVAPRASVRLHADHALLLLESSGLPCVATTAADPQPAEGRAVVAVWTGDTGVSEDDVVRLVTAARANQQRLVVVTDDASWKSLASRGVWEDGVGTPVVVPVGQRGPSLLQLPWPDARSVWVGAPEAPSSEATTLPEGTTLLEGLGLLDVRSRPGRLVAWRPDAVATVCVAARASGAVVVSAGMVGGDVPVGRDALLRFLDGVRRWRGLRLAVVWGERDDADCAVEEPVQRVGFYFSRLDDERGGGDCAAHPPHSRRIASSEAVARSLVGFGLADAALSLLRSAEPESAWGVEEEMLLGFLVAETNPNEAITRLRHAALRLAHAADQDAWERQTDATLNALLLLVRTNQVPAVDAWATISAWLDHAGLRWVVSSRHAAVLFELAARAGRAAEARRFAVLFRSLGPSKLGELMEPLIHAVVGSER